MSRTITQIYADAVKTRNDYLQITELNTGKSSGKMSVLNVITYVMASLIFTYETMLDVFQVEIAQIISNRINGTPRWYITIAKLFQYNVESDQPDTLIFDEDTLSMRYQEIDATKRIVSQAAYEDREEDNGITLKVCKANDNQTEIENGTIYKPLSENELVAFKSYIAQMKFVGAKIFSISIPGDILEIRNCTIIYDNNYITKDMAFSSVVASLVNYAKNLQYDGMIYYQSVIDAISDTEHIVTVEANAELWLRKYDPINKTYKEAEQITGRTRTASGYISFIDPDGQNVLNTDNLNFQSNE